MLTVGFHGTTPTPFIRRFLQDEQGGGVILFRRNLQEAEDILHLNQSLRELAPGPVPYLMVDQEGGPVMRLRKVASLLPPMGKVGAMGRVHDARKAGQILGREVRALGFNVNCAPVLDVHSNPQNPIIGDRAFSTDPEMVGKLGEAFIRGMQAMGVLACGKHFPGHGDTSVDSHLDLPVLPHGLERLREVELVPFRHVVKTAPPALMMTAHILLPELDPKHPCTLSETILPQLIRQEMGYGGVVVTDDLEMKAIDDRYAMEEVVRLGLKAGIDVFLICHDEEKQQLALDTLRKLLTDGEVTPERIQGSLKRIHRTKTALATTPVATQSEMASSLLRSEDQDWIERMNSI